VTAMRTGFFFLVVSKPMSPKRIREGPARTKAERDLRGDR
jgi:hypothetical protein